MLNPFSPVAVDHRVAYHGICAQIGKHQAHIFVDTNTTDFFGNLIFWDCPGRAYDCTNCDDRKCMGCVFRQWDHVCRENCPECC